MADTLIVYLEKEICEDCGETPVNYIHWGALTQGERKKLCASCMKKRSESK